MTREEWEIDIPVCIRQDSAWRVEAYRLSLFLSDLAWADATKLIADRRTVSIAGQLVRSAGSISSDIIEGYSRQTGRDRARFYEYGLGSARESRDWYYKGRHILGMEVVDHRMELCTQIIRLTITMVSRERRSNRKIVVKQQDE